MIQKSEVFLINFAVKTLNKYNRHWLCMYLNTKPANKKIENKNIIY